VSWEVEEATGSAADFHARAVPDPPRRLAWMLAVDRPALVLGSTQSASVADAAACEAAGVEVVHRRSGGGAVLLEPGGAAWVDLVVPRDDPLWDDDVGRAAHWVGGAWAAALGLQGSAVHRGPLVRTPWSDLVCFAGLGPGEVTSAGGAKVVGISQRRTRAAARFQCVALGEWVPSRVLALLDLPGDDRRRAAADLAGAATGVDVAGLPDRVVANLPS
jgi:lipoate---protein ligase